MKKTAFVILPLLYFAACTETSNPAQQQDASTADSVTTTQMAAVDNCQSNAPVFAPKIESINDASLKAYLAALTQAVQQQNASELRLLLDPHIATGFDGSGGIIGFDAQWNPGAKESEVWLILRQLLELGGTRLLYQGNDSNSFALPYVYSAWPDSLDAFSYSAVVHEGAILRAEPAVNAPAVCALGLVVLKVDYSKSYPQQEGVREKEWWHVTSPDEQLKGYLYKRDLYSPVGYRAILNKNKQGKWRMTALVAGD